jgi:ATP-binding cassette subfamily B protein
MRGARSDALARQRAQSTLTGVKITWQVGRLWVVLLGLTSVIEGALPAVSTVAGGRLLGAVPKALAEGGLGSPAGHSALWAMGILVGAFALGQTSDALTFAAAQGFSSRVLFRVNQRAMAASLAPARLDHLLTPEHRELVDMAEADRWPNMFAFVSGLRRLITFRVIALTSAVLVARYDWRLALALVAVYGAVGHRLRARQRKAVNYGDEPVRRAHYFRELALSADAAQEMRVFGLVPWMLANFDDAWRTGMAPVWKARRSSALEVAILLVTIVAANVFAFGRLAAAAHSGQIGVPTLMVVASAMLTLCQLGLVLPEDDHVAQGAAVAAALAKGEARSAVAVAAEHQREPLDVKARAHELRVEGLRFSYHEDSPLIYDGLDLVAPAGRSLAIVGANGAGKTTLVKLLAGLHQPQDGRILADGVDISELDRSAWQRRIAAIFQDFTHYPMSAADNVGFGAVDLGADPSLLDRAAERAGATDLIAGLPDGWATVLSRSFSGGVDLSGGQWQRMALARAVAAVEGGAGVLVLDEPTANLDVRGEVELFDRFLEVTKGCTTILISHRFSTVRRADRIVVLDKGRVVEEGTHAELVAKRGRYARLFALQAARYRDDDFEEEAG